MGHTHDHTGGSDRNLYIAIFINVLLTVAQIIGGLLAGSLSLVADALHNLSDAGAILVALIARKLGRKPANDSYSFGYGRAEILATAFNSLTLILVGLYLLFEAWQRYQNPTPVDGFIIFVVAGIALVIDIVTALLTLKAGAKDSMNLRAAFIHNVSDAMASVAVIIAGVFIMLFDWYIADLIVTAIISAYVMYHGVLLLCQACRVLMQAAPAELDLALLRAALQSDTAVAQVNSLTAWQLTDKDVQLGISLSVTKVSDGEQARLRQLIQTLVPRARLLLELSHAPKGAADAAVLSATSAGCLH
ncbi:cation diffusion facilitator family transporter [Shewanella sp. JM162201]|uniref:Cation diffusion facilitator family transporter n=1 Tax=Shewanella jiangmenensis TaxID=2837387 RepID=A0ABS5V9R5_9GAMM|nr:cation diffusion facilitator family transporter [Shewanella jiangmenensis]MBT1446401.1 cation diffusion facilitator family transporter [Shewanella jiangmenensis]